MFWVYKRRFVSADTPIPPSPVPSTALVLRPGPGFVFQGSKGRSVPFVLPESPESRFRHVRKSLRWVSFVVPCLIQTEPPARIHSQRGHPWLIYDWLSPRVATCRGILPMIPSAQSV